MIILNSSDKSLVASLNTTSSFGNVHYIVQFVDIDSGCNYVGLDQVEGFISTSGETTLLPAPPSGILRRDIKFIKIHNDDVVTHPFELSVSSSIGSVHISDIDLLSEHTMYYTANGDIELKDSFGRNVVSSEIGSGSFLAHGDTPSTYAGSQGYFTTVNGSALVFSDPDNLTVGTASYIDASNVEGVLTSSFAETASYAIFAETSSCALKAVSSSFAVTASYVDGISATASYILSQNVITPSISSSYGTLYQYQNIQESIGVIEGGEVTSNGDGTININSGSAFVKGDDTIFGEISAASFQSGSNLSVNPYDTQVYFYVDYNGGSPTILSSSINPNGDDTKVLLASVVKETAPLDEIHISQYIKTVGHSGWSLWQQRNRATDTFARESGGVTSISGSLNVLVSAGEFWQGLTEFSTPSFDSSVTDFEYFYRSGSVWFEFDSNQLDHTIYNDLTIGTTGSLSPNNYGVHWVYLETDGDIGVVLGRGNYPNIAAAEGEAAPTTLPPHFSKEHAGLVARVITREDHPEFSQVDTTYETTFEFGTTTSHLNLSDLQGGKVNEYYHLTQTEAVNLDDTPVIVSSQTSSMSVASASYVKWGDVDEKPFSLVNNLDSDLGIEVVDLFPTSSGRSAEWLINVYSGSNMRTSKVMACWLDGQAEYTEFATNDIGNTKKMDFTVDVLGGDVRLLIDNDNSNDWEIKTIKTVV